MPIFDNKRVLREGLEMTLRGEGLEVRTSRAGDETLKKIAEKSPDLALLDMMKSRMNGFLSCEEIHRTDDLLPVIFHTSKDAEADQVHDIGLVADNYVSKDCGDAVMLVRIRHAEPRHISPAVCSGQDHRF